jgi:hypothetical protein
MQAMDANKWSSTAVDLLWTGGWDSTFRLLQLCREGRKVRLHYIISRNRDSFKIEMETMEWILERIFRRYAVRFFRVIVERADILPNEEIRIKWRQICGKYSLGPQYEWLAEYAAEHQLTDLEMSVVSGEGRMFQVLREFSEPREDGCWRLSTWVQQDFPFSIFRPFSFPLMSFTKIQLQQLAREQGFLDILNRSWFCCSPANNEPCGYCNPCKCTIEAGLEHRFSRRALRRYQHRDYYLELRERRRRRRELGWRIYLLECLQQATVSGFFGKLKKRISL